MSLLEGELAETIGDALLDANIPFALTLTRTTTTGGTPWDPGETVSTNYVCQGFVDTYSDEYIDGTRILTGDVKVVIIAKTLSVVPQAGDSVTAHGKTYSVVSVTADPAIALYTVQARR